MLAGARCAGSSSRSDKSCRNTTGTWRSRGTALDAGHWTGADQDGHLRACPITGTVPPPLTVLSRTEGYDQRVTSEVHGVQADLYDARAAAFYAAAGKPGPAMEADREVEAGQ
jgi:hypothetical protein